MKIKIRRKRGRKMGSGSVRLHRRVGGRDDVRDYVEIGQGDYCAITVNPFDGSAVVQRFATAEEAQAQHGRNVAADIPGGGATEPN